MKARFAAPSRQLVVMFRGPPASYAKGTPRDGTKGRQHRWGGALGRGAAPDSQDGGRAAGKLARAPGAQRVGRPGGGALGRPTPSETAARKARARGRGSGSGVFATRETASRAASPQGLQPGRCAGGARPPASPAKMEQ